MALKNKIYLIILALVGQLFFFGHIPTESLEAGGSVPNQEIFLPVSAPEQDHLTLVSFFRLVAQDTIVGGIAIYDDAGTKRPGDYLELYNRAGDLLAVSWFDRFGIERTAVDRGLLEAADKLHGIFIVLIDGDSV